MHNKELRNLYFPPDIIRVIKSRRMIRKTHGEATNAYKILVGKPEGKGPLGRATHRCEDNI